MGKDRQRARQADAQQLPAAAATGDTAMPQAAQEPEQAAAPDQAAARPGAAESGMGSDLASGVAAGGGGNAAEHQDDAATQHGSDPPPHAVKHEVRAPCILPQMRQC